MTLDKRVELRQTKQLSSTTDQKLSCLIRASHHNDRKVCSERAVAETDTLVTQNETKDT